MKKNGDKKNNKTGFGLYAATAVAGIAVAVAAAYFSYHTVKDALVESESESLKSLAETGASSLKEEFEEKENLILSIYGDDFSSEEDFEAALDKIFCDKAFYTRNDYEHLPYWNGEQCRRAVQEPQSVISGPTVYRYGGYYVFYMTKAISIAGEIAGVLQFEWNLNSVFNQSETLSGLEINNDGYCYVKNSAGMTVMSEDGADREFPDISKPEAQSQPGEAEVTSYWSYTVENGVPVRKNELAAVASVEIGDEIFSVYVVEDYGLLVKPIERLSFCLSMLGAVIFVWILVSLRFYMKSVKRESELRVSLKYEEELSKAGERLAKQDEVLRVYNRDKELTSLWGALAHEFNNQMTPILIYAELFKNNKAVSELMPEETEELYLAAEHCSTLSRQMLEFSRAGRAERKKVKFNASEEVRLSLKMVEKLVPSNIEFKYFVSKRDFYVLGQVGMLSQIIINLSNNAIRAMKDKDEGLLEITFGRSKDRDDFVTLIVEDNGTGIDYEIQRHIFEPFFTTKPPKEGSGIGLTVVARLLQENGGYIDAFSEPGKGSRFTAGLPCY